MELQLADSVVFIAGSSRGIGRSISEKLLAEGARVIITGRSQTDLDSAYLELSAKCNAGGILAIAGDLCDDAAISSAFSTAVDRFGRIDHLIANLGTGSGKAGWDQPADEWERLFEMNFFASTRLARHAIPILLANEAKGSILFISSIVAFEATLAPLPYSAAKA